VRIVSVAVVTDTGLICVGIPGVSRHSDVHELMRTMGIDTITHGFNQGFIDSNGAYQSRTAARIIAEKAEQIIPRADGRIYTQKELFSEDLW
jgi:hypothetical protein